MELEIVEYAFKNTDIVEKIGKIKDFYGIPEKEILETGILTAIASEIYPNYKNYTHIVSGISQARMVKGVNGKNFVESQIQKIENTYGLNEINEALLGKAVELVILTIDSIYDKNNKKLIKAYTNALNDPEFLYINLKLMVKIIGEHLRKNNVELLNKTLQYMTDYISSHKSTIQQTFMNAYSTGDLNLITEAKKDYRERMTEMLTQYIKGLKINYDDTMQFAMEQKIVEKLERDNVDTLLNLLIFQMKEEIMKNNSIQRMLEF